MTTFRGKSKIRAKLTNATPIKGDALAVRNAQIARDEAAKPPEAPIGTATIYTSEVPITERLESFQKVIDSFLTKALNQLPEDPTAPYRQYVGNLRMAGLELGDAIEAIRGMSEKEREGLES